MNKKMLTKEIFWDIRRKMIEKFPDITHVKFEPCFLADEKDKEARPEYCHWNHKSGVICFSKKFLDLPVEYKKGILLHQFGKVIDDKHVPFEDEEDEQLEKIDEEPDADVRADMIAAAYLDPNYSIDSNDVPVVAKRNPFIKRKLESKV